MNHVYVDTGLLLTESSEEYHSQAPENLSSHQLADFMRCPLLYHRKHLGLIEDKETPSYLIGRAAHTRILEGLEAYERDYALGGPINPTTGRPYGTATKKFAEWRAKQGKSVLSFEQVDLIEQMASAVARNDHAVNLISYGVAEGVVRTEYCGVPCQIRLDPVQA